MIELTPQLRNNNDIPLYSQLYEYIKKLILTGEIKAGEKLPSIRHLSRYLNISKNTVVTCYDQLAAEGYIISKGRSGLFVEMLNNGSIRMGSESGLVENFTSTSNQGFDIKYDLRNAQIDLDSFPYSLWRKVSNQCINSEMKELLNYGEHQGEEKLREQIARYLFLSRGVRCRPEQILIGAGTQQSLTMLCLIIRSIGRNIAFEEPGYIGARKVFANNEFNIIPIPLEADGINLKHLKNSSAKTAYITPSHQFPCGMVMPVPKRLMLLQWAQERDAYIVEDDYDGEFRYQGKPIPALQGLDNFGRVIYLGTFSKALIPSIRVSFVVLPDKLLEIYKKNFSIYEQPVSRFNQKALQLFMEQGFWDRHVKKMRNLYKKKHEILLTSINEILGDSVEIIGKDSGLHILIRVKNNMSEAELIESAGKVKVGVSPTSLYWTDKPANSTPLIFIGFGGINALDIPESIYRLKQSWF